MQAGERAASGSSYDGAGHASTLRLMPLRVRVRPHAPLPERPILLPCSSESTLTALRPRIVKALLTELVSDPDKLRLEIEGFAIAEDGPVVDVVRENDVVDVFLDEEQAHKANVVQPEKNETDNSQSSNETSASSASSSASSTSSSTSSDDSSGSCSSEDEDDSSSSDESAEVHMRRAADFVPPGQGLARTQRNNRSRRQKERKLLNEERQKGLIEAIRRAEKRTRGEPVDEEAAQMAWTVDRQGGNGTAASHMYSTRRPKGGESASPLLGMPPGGGTLGLPNFVEVITNAQAMPKKRQVQTNGIQNPTPKKKQRRRILPPSQRSDPIPASIRLTRVDCDECMTPWPVEEEQGVQETHPDAGSEEDLYAAFQVQGREALRKMRAADEETSKAPVEERQAEKDDFSTIQAAMGLPLSFGKPAGWDGNDVLTSKAMTDAPASVATAPPSTRNATLSSTPSHLSALDYGQPDEEDNSVQKSLERLRRLRGQAQQKAVNVDNATLANKTDLAAIRQAALSSMKRKADAIQIA